MVMAKASTLFEVLAQAKVDPDEMIFHMNNDLFNTKTGGMFVTCILGIYDLITDEIKWVNGGHQSALIRNEKGKFEEYESKTPPLGILLQKSKSAYIINKKKLDHQRFYAFTDGLSESFDKNKNELGIEGTKKIINNNFNDSPNIELKHISQEAIKISGYNKLKDDLTIIVIGK